MKKKTSRPVGIAHNPQLGTIVVLDDGSAVRLVIDAEHKPVGWEPLPAFDVIAEDEEPAAAE